MAQHEENTVDLDALQAQIDLSMAFTEELVASWIRPGFGASSKATQNSDAIDKELQDYLRRPPRLGVGASIPESVSSSLRENMALKNKLAVSDKKRKREEVSERHVQEDGDERKGESGKNTKGSRIDPFSGSKKRKKINNDLNDQKCKIISSLTNTPLVGVVEGGTLNTSAVSKQFLPENVSAKEITIQHQDSTKPADQEKTGEQDTDTTVPISSPATVKPDQTATSADDVDNEEEWTGFGDSIEMLIPVSSGIDITEVSSLNGSGKPPSPIIDTPRQHSLLNLHGPPLEEGTTQPARKRRRRMKKRHSKEAPPK